MANLNVLYLPNEPTGNGLQDTPYETTTKAGLSPGKLCAMARRVTQEDLDLKLLRDLRGKGIGTFKIECQALALSKDAEKRNERKEEKGGQRKDKWGQIVLQRSQAKVVDVLNLKIKYCEAKKKWLKTEYIKEKKRLLRVLKSVMGFFTIMK